MDGSGGNPFESLLSYVTGSQTDDREKLREIGMLWFERMMHRGRVLVANGHRFAASSPISRQ